MNKIKKYLLVPVLVFIFQSISFSQIDGPLIILNRGQLWESFSYGKVGPQFSNWARFDVGMDWPGYFYEYLPSSIGGPISHLLTGGFWIGARDSAGKPIYAEDWTTSTGGVTIENTSRYIAKRHEKLYKYGENYWLKKNPNEAEDVVISEWEYNPNYARQDVGQTTKWDNRLPIRVKRTVRQWSGSMRDENLIIIEYVLKNVYNDLVQKYPIQVLKDSLSKAMNSIYLLHGYAFAINTRGWKILAPTFTSGARNNRFVYNSTKRLLYGYADAFNEFSSTLNEGKQYDWYNQGGPQQKGEWLAPAYAGLAFLYIPPDSTKNKNRINRACWVAADNTQDNYPVFGGTSSGIEYKLQQLKDPTLIGSTVVLSPGDERMTKNRMWSLVSTGAWNLAPGDSMKIVTAEVIAGVPYSEAINPSTLPSRIGSYGSSGITETVDKAQFIYDHNYNTIDPPAAPSFSIKLYDKKAGFVANSITWYDSCEALPDPDYTTDEKYDLAGYRVYRSNYLPIGPWEKVVDIKKGDPNVYNSSTHQYNFIDSTVSMGFSYYYAITAYDSGHSAWPVDLAYKFKETGSNKVPPLESSIFANRTVTPFTATIPPIQNTLDKVLIVPNPFISRSGLINPTDQDVIQFINIPNPCTIRIYSIRGDLVKKIEHNDGSGIASWNQITDYGQYVKSGVYIYHLETNTGLKKIGKFAIIR
jgi:hypothetical protein